MRDATLGGLSALETTRPRRDSGRGRAPAKARGGEGGWTRFRRFRTRLALIVGSAGFTAIMIGIVVNATMEQKEHHPAPLFGSAPVRAAVPVRAKPEVRPSPAVAPAPAAPPATDETQSLPAVAAPTHAALARPSKAVDGIARLLGTLPPSDRQRAPGKAVPAPRPKAAQLVVAKPAPSLPAAARDRPAPAAVN